MRSRLYATALLLAPVMIAMVLAVPVVPTVSAETAEVVNWIQLRDGVKARLLGAREAKVGGEPELQGAFQLSDNSLLKDHAAMISIADQLFARVVLIPAETKSYTRAAVLVLASETKVGDTTTQGFDDFHYQRGADTVWLRQAGPEDWKVAQDPKAFTPPVSEEVDLGALGKIQLDFVGEVFSSGGATKTLGIEAHSATNVADTERKYQELKALWTLVDREKLKEQGFDAVAMENYDRPRIGEFQVRYRVFVNIRRPAAGDWPTLPDKAPVNGPLIAMDRPSGSADWANLASRGVAAAAPQRAAVRAEFAAAGLPHKVPDSRRLRMRAADVLKH